MKSKLQKVKEYCKDNGFKNTVKKVYRTCAFKLEVKQKTKLNTVYNLTKEETQVTKLKSKNRVFIFANTPYFDANGKVEVRQIANTFNSFGYMVNYFYLENATKVVKQILPLVKHEKIVKEEIEKMLHSEDICIFEENSNMFLPYIEIAKANNCRIFCDLKENEDYYELCSKIIDDNTKCNEEFYDNVSIVILNYNNKNVIENCIDTILKFNDRYKVEIIVVDNQSTDGSYELLQEKYKDKIKLLRNSKNGCSSGRNLGVENASKNYIMFLDSDQWILHKYWLDPYIEILTNNNKIGAIGWAAGWFNKEGYSYNVVDSFPYKYIPPTVLYRTDIGYLGTGGLILKKELFNKIEGFDLYYDPTCYEDTDLSLKIRNAGFEIAYTIYLGVGHLPHQTTKSGTKEHDKLIKSKGDYFVSKWKKINPSLLKYIK